MKYLILGCGPAGIADPQAQGLSERGIQLRHGKRAEKIDSAGNRVILTDGAEEAYDVLLVATGGKPGMRTRIPPRCITGYGSPPASSTC